MKMRDASDNTPGGVIVIGGGLAGLTAACYLARAGCAVTLFEQAPELGGRAATDTIGGFDFNRGAHALYSGGAASKVLSELGVSYTYGTPTSVSVLQQGRFSPFPAKLLALLRSPLLHARDKLELGRVFAAVASVDAHSLASTSVQSWIERASKRTQVRRFLAGLARPFLYTAALDLVSAEVLIDKWQRARTHPVQYIDGGWQTLVDGLRDQAEQAGARIRKGCGVASIEFGAGQMYGVRLREGRAVPARAVVVATRPHAALKFFENGQYAPMRAEVERLIPAHIACLDVALQRLPAPHHAVVQDLDRPRFLTAQSQYARVAPPGAALIHLFKQLDPRAALTPEADELELEGLLDLAQPGWRNLLEQRTFLPHMEAVSALPLAECGGFAGRPSLQVPGLFNAYLAGDWVGSEGFLIDASLASARAAAHLILHGPMPTTTGRMSVDRLPVYG